MPDSDSRATVTLGLVADPDAPQRVAEYLARTLPEELDDGDDWTIEVEVDAVTAGRQTVEEILRATGKHRRERGWEYAICVTDLPVRRAGCPILADVNLTERVAVISLPTLGGLQPYRRTHQVIRQLLDDFTAARPRLPHEQDGRRDGDQDAAADQHGLDSRLTKLLGPIHRQVFTGDNGEVDVRYRATRRRGRARLLTGMVRTNRPWRLVFGLSRALAAAVAASAFGLSSSTIWQLADRLDSARQLGAVAGAIAVLVVWLIAAHRLWETRSRATAHDREQVWLYNASTVTTLVIGVACLYLTLFAVNLGIATFLVPTSLLTSILEHPADFSSFVGLAWAFTTMGAIAGALGSSLESDHAVRQAAYGYREQRRRADYAAAQR